jgi:hypothetical protein
LHPPETLIPGRGVAVCRTLFREVTIVLPPVPRRGDPLETKVKGVLHAPLWISGEPPNTGHGLRPTAQDLARLNLSAGTTWNASVASDQERR